MTNQCHFNHLLVVIDLVSFGATWRRLHHSLVYKQTTARSWCPQFSICCNRGFFGHSRFPINAISLALGYFRFRSGTMEVPVPLATVGEGIGKGIFSIRRKSNPCVFKESSIGELYALWDHSRGFKKINLFKEQERTGW